ncbi:MAG: Nif3-like dinuclear metal center hexameric protein [Clostridia bacterium]|nr:Nif3-like dinuclear metal center hexameric protein [Clostridia bacterium]
MDFSVLERYNDTSGLKRIGSVSEDVRSLFSSEFLKYANGLFFDLKDREIDTVVFSVFLDQNCLDYVLNQLDGKKVLIVVHHFFDIDCGYQESSSGTDSFFCEPELYKRLYASKVQICVLHLPLDINSSRINTHKSFLENVWGAKKLQQAIYSFPFAEMGYYLHLEKEAFNFVEQFDKILYYGNQYANCNDAIQGLRTICDSRPLKVAVWSGMTNTTDILKEMENQKCDFCLCGDVIIRNRSDRSAKVLTYLENMPLNVFCVSHYQSELFALKDLAKKLESLKKDLHVHVIEDKEIWK